MRVAMYYNNRCVKIEEMPVPKIGPGEILMKVAACGICGSDLMEWYRIHKAPLILGHELAGTVSEVGRDVKGFGVGDRIAASHHVPCLNCFYCKTGHETACDLLRRTNFDPGGYVEILRIPAVNIEKGGVYKLPDNLSFEDATFIEPLACILRAQRRADMRPGKSVLVMGSGISGLIHIHYAKVMGASRIVATDLIPERLEMARRLGADAVISAKDYSPEKFMAENGGRLADIVITTCSAEKAIGQGIGSVDRGGTVMLFAPTREGAKIYLSVNDTFWRNDVTITTSYAATPSDHVEAMNLLASGRVNFKPMITHRLGLSDTQKGFGLVANPGPAIKVIIQNQI